MKRSTSPRSARIEELKQQIRDVTGEQSIFGTMPGCPPEVEEAFLQQVLDFHANKRPLVRDVFRESGIVFPSPDTLNDAELSVGLWEMIGELGSRSIVLEFTNHLSDRQLYAHLWNWMFEETMRMPPPGQVLHLDIAGGRSASRIFMKYYADAELRRAFAIDFPNTPLPEPAEPPYKRDHLLPGHEGRPTE